jgi:hypothetical protein
MSDVLSAGGYDHVVLFHAGEMELADQVHEHLFGAGEPGTAILIATPEHCRLITDRMARAGIDVQAARASGSFVVLDASETLASLMVEGWPDAAAFWRTMSPVLKRALARPGEVRVFGEMVALLWAADQTAAAVDLEALWNELARQYSFSLLCAYPADAVARDEQADELAHVHDVHSAVLSAGSRG